MVNDQYYSIYCDILNTFEYKIEGADDSTYVTIEPANTLSVFNSGEDPEYTVTNSPSFVSSIF